jgi:hypothetical protein
LKGLVGIFLQQWMGGGIVEKGLHHTYKCTQGMKNNALWWTQDRTVGKWYLDEAKKRAWENIAQLLQDFYLGKWQTIDTRWHANVVGRAKI